MKGLFLFGLGCVIAWDIRKNDVQSLTLTILLPVNPGRVDLFFLFPGISVKYLLAWTEEAASDMWGVENPLLFGVRLRPYFYQLCTRSHVHQLLFQGWRRASSCPAIPSLCLKGKYFLYQNIFLWCIMSLKCYISDLGLAREIRV